MSQSDIEQLLIAAINKVQADSGRPSSACTPDTKPLTDIPEFDSLNGVEVTLYIEAELKHELGITNVFAEGNSELDIRDAATRIFKAVK